MSLRDESAPMTPTIPGHPVDVQETPWSMLYTVDEVIAEIVNTNTDTSTTSTTSSTSLAAAPNSPWLMLYTMDETITEVVHFGTGSLTPSSSTTSTTTTSLDAPGPVLVMEPVWSALGTMDAPPPGLAHVSLPEGDHAAAAAPDTPVNSDVVWDVAS